MAARSRPRVAQRRRRGVRPMERLARVEDGRGRVPDLLVLYWFIPDPVSRAESLRPSAGGRSIVPNNPPVRWRRRPVLNPAPPLTERTSKMRGIPPVRPQTPDTPAGARQRGQGGDEHTFRFTFPRTQPGPAGTGTPDPCPRVGAMTSMSPSATRSPSTPTRAARAAVGPVSSPKTATTTSHSGAGTIWPPGTVAARRRATVRLADGDPGVEVQVDFGRL